MNDIVERLKNKSERINYGLGALAFHLKTAKQYDKLWSLFDTDRWMRMRVEASNYIYTGFLRDLEIAWSGLQEVDAEMLDSSSPTFPRYVHLGLIKSSVASLSKIPVRLLMRAATVRYWSIDHVLAVVSRYPSLAERVSLYTSLLKLDNLRATERQAVQVQAFEAFANRSTKLPLRHFVQLLPYLSDNAAKEFVDEIVTTISVDVHPAVWDQISTRKDEDEEFYVDEAIDLLPFLTGGQQAKVVIVVVEGILETVKHSLQHAKKQFPRAETPAQTLFDQFHYYQTETFIQELEGLGAYASQLRRLAPFLKDHPHRHKIIEQLVTILELTDDIHFLQQVVSAFAPFFEGDLLTRIQRRITALRDTGAFNVTNQQTSASKHDDKMHYKLRQSESLDDLYHRIMKDVVHQPSLPWDGSIPAEILTQSFQAMQVIFSNAPGLSDDELHSLVNDYIDNRTFAYQLYRLDSKSMERSDQQIAAKFQECVARVKAALLCSALNYAHQHNRPLANAWQHLPDTFLGPLELSVLLDFVCRLPSEPERNQLSFALFSDDKLCPRLEALTLFVSRLQGPLLIKALDNILEISDLTTRRTGLELLAPYLGRLGVARALAAIQVIPDFLEQHWALDALASNIESQERQQLIQWDIAAALQIVQGKQLGIELAQLMQREALHPSSTAILRHVLHAIALCDPKNRMDALMSLAYNWQGTLPGQLVDAILALPTINSGRIFSWRGHAIMYLIDRFPTEELPQVWQAIQELPCRLSIGDSEKWGWNWYHEYPFAAAIYALVPRLHDELLHKAFEEAKQFHWAAREDIFCKMALNAESDLAGEICDYILAMAEKYETASLSTQLLFEWEDAIIPDSIEVFRLQREIGCAEVIAALAPKLDEFHLLKAAEKAASFSNIGPSAWLTGKLAPYLPETLLSKILPIATVDALEFIAGDPTRFDLLTELMPYIKRATESQMRPIQQLLSTYFPERTDLLLNLLDFAVLSPEDMDLYMRFLDDSVSTKRKQQLISENQAMSKQEKRKALEEMILTPIFASQIEKNALQLLLEAPLPKRLEALPSLKERLTAEQMELVVTCTFREVLQSERANSEKLTDVLIRMLPYLPETLYQTVLAIALEFPDARKLTEDDLAQGIYGEILRDFAGKLHSRFEREFDSVVGMVLGRKISDDSLYKSFGNIESHRTRLLNALLPRLEEHQLAQVIDTMLKFPELERIAGICTVMPLAPQELKEHIYAHILSMRSAFGRTYIFWRMLEHLNETQRQGALPDAIAAAQSLKSKTLQATALLTLTGLTETNEQYQSMLRLALDIIATIENESDALETLTIFIPMAAAYPPIVQDTLALILNFKEHENQMKGLLLFARDDQQDQAFPSAYAMQIRWAAIQHVRHSSALERKLFLTDLANIMPVYKPFVTEQSAYSIAESIKKISHRWQWL